jgi:hypothetical protein
MLKSSIKRPQVFMVSLLLGLVAFTDLAPAREFVPGQWQRLEELPPGRFRSQLDQLPAPAQERSRRWLRSFHFTTGDLESLHVDRAGGIFYICDPAPKSTTVAAAAPVLGEVTVPITPFPTNLIFHSRPGSPNVLYLNFNGETVTNSQWNTLSNRTVFNAVPFSIDGDYANFNDAEQLAIKRIWQRMAEDYAPFDIDVTTERPASFNNRTAHALITRSTDANGLPNPASNAGGVAYVNVFNTASYATYRPAWVYSDNLGPGEESYIAEAASHEVGHNLGLSHDGTSTSGYYGGHGSGDTSWGPIMGTGYNRNVSQWCKGEYLGANNTEDDLSIIAGKLTYRPDLVGSNAAAATALILSNGTNIVSTTPETDPTNTNTANKGVLERNTDVDVFSFVTGSGPVNLSVTPWVMSGAYTRGGNLDVRLELYNEAGALVLSNNPAALTTAAIQTNLVQGRYYLHVKNTGVGTPLANPPSGYTSYGSIGQYFINGFVTASSGFVAAPLATASVTDLTTSGQGSKTFTVTYTDDVAVNVSTLGSTDVRVTGPNGYQQFAQFISVDVAVNGTPRTATYSVPPPNGTTWLPADNGLYTLTLQSNQVADIEGAFVAAGPLGQFNVAVPVSVYSANFNVNPGWTLQPDWQYGVPNYSSGGPTTGFTGTSIIGYNLSGDYPNNLSVRYATTPVINAAGSSSLTLQFRRWLGVRNLDSATIEASTNGVNWVSVWSSAGANLNDNAWQLVQYPLPPSVVGSATLRLRWALSSGGNGNRPAAIGWNLDDVEILGGGSIDTASPASSLSVANVTSAGSPNQSCTVTYTDTTAVALATLDSADLFVTGPAGYSNAVEFLGADLPLDGSPLTASYAVPAPGGAWDVNDNGTYTLTLVAGQVADTLNNVVTQTVLGNFAVAIPTNTPGALAVTPAFGLSSTGFVGGAFSPASLAYTLTNSGGSSLTWSASRNAAWFDLSATNGVLAPAGSATVLVSLNPTANTLPPGDYADSVSFVNVTTGAGNTFHAVNLTVNPIPTVTLALSAVPSAWGSVSPANGNYPLGTNVQLLATPAPYYQFTGWSGAVSGASNPLGVTLNSNFTAQASFAELFTTNYPTPHWWLAANGYTNDFENAVTNIGPNGHPLWQSYVAGLDPNNPSSQLRLTVTPAVINGSELVFTWNTVTGRVYSLWSSPDLALAFAPLPGATNLPSSVSAFTNQVDAGAAGAFFRLEVQKP